MLVFDTVYRMPCRGFLRGKSQHDDQSRREASMIISRAETNADRSVLFEALRRWRCPALAHRLDQW